MVLIWEGDWRWAIRAGPGRPSIYFKCLVTPVELHSSCERGRIPPNGSRNIDSTFRVRAGSVVPPSDPAFALWGKWRGAEVDFMLGGGRKDERMRSAGTRLAASRYFQRMLMLARAANHTSADTKVIFAAIV